MLKRSLLAILLILGGILMTQAQDSEPEVTPDPQPQLTYHYTYHQVTGNRIVNGQGTFPDAQSFDVQLESLPIWLVGGTAPDNITRWQIIDTNGIAQQVIINLSTLEISRIPPAEDATITTAIPVLVLGDGASGNLRSFDNPTSLTHPVPITDDLVVQVTYNGDLAIWRGVFELDRISLNIQTDARIVISDTGLIAVYANATNERYVHAIMGDDIEGSSLVILNVVEDKLNIVAQVDLPGEDIYEGLSPIWADVNEDGVQDLITTISNSFEGAWMRAYIFDGENIISEVDSPSIGQGNRWRHQLAWGAFGANGEMQLASVLTPHIGGIVEFMQYTGTSLQIVGRQGGYSSHLIRSRNLDMAVAGDFDGDGQPEIVVPSQDYTRIAGIVNSAEGARVAWELPVGGQIITNLSALQLPDGRLGLAVGTTDNRVRLWLPASDQ